MKGAWRRLGAVAAATLIVIAMGAYWSAAMLITRAAGTPAWVVPLAHWSARDVADSIVQVPVRSGTIRARLFRPDGGRTRSAMLVGGVHPDGIDEPRLVALARELAATGVVVLTPEIGDLMHYTMTSRVTDTIEDVARWMATRRDEFGDAGVGLVGVSFSGGLSVVAAGRPSVRDRIAYVLSYGGHGNLPRVLRYLCTGEGAAERPHDYGLAVILHQAAELAVPPEQVEELRAAVKTFLDASALDRTDRTKAGQLFEAARQRVTAMAEPSATLMKYVSDRNVVALGARLEPYLDRLGQDPALSPDRSPPPSAPVYLLHGAGDNVIPTEESVRLAEHLRDKTRVRLLVSGFLAHADVAARPGMRDTWNMIAFWKALLDEY
jgi:dienelactone hydrolase